MASLHVAAAAARRSAPDDEPRLREAFAGLARPRRLRSGETLIAEGAPSCLIGVVANGVLRLQKLKPDGHIQILGLMFAGDLVGLPFGHVALASVEAATDATVLCLGRGDFEALLGRDPGFARRMLLAMFGELGAAHEALLLLGSPVRRQRIALFLTMLARRRSGDGARDPARSVAIPICRRDMAAYLGTTVETISRTLQDLARQRVIRLADPRHFETLDPVRLHCLAGVDPSEPLLRQRHDPLAPPARNNDTGECVRGV
jgi:CRP/FNR family transcriptional regulator